MIGGLLGQGWDDPRSHAVMGLAAGLLKGDFGGGLLAANQGFMEMTKAKKQEELDKVRTKLLEAQIGETQAQAEERRIRLQREQEALNLERLKREGLPSIFRQPGMTGGEAVPQELGGIPMFSKPMGVTPMQATPGGIDVMRALRLGYKPNEINDLHGLTNLGMPEVARTVEEDDGQGGKRTVQLDKFGRRVGQGLPGYIPPVEVRQGDRVTFAKPTPGASFRVYQSPDSAASVAATIRGQNMTDLRQREMAEITREAGQTQIVTDPILGPMLVNKGTGVARPAVGTDGKPLGGEKAVQGVKDANEVLGLLNEAEKILPNATNSYTGAGADLFMGGVFGSATEGAKATAQLKALQGALVAKMPKMSGPQSDKDVLLYREMAGQIGDPTLPIGVRQAAISTIRKLNEKYAGVPEGSSKPAPPEPVTPNLRWNPKTRKVEPVVR